MRWSRRAAAEDVAWLGLLAAAILLAAAFAWIAPILARHYPAPATDTFAVWRSLIAPEPREEVRSVLALGTPFLLGAVVVSLGSRQAPRRSMDPIVVGLEVIGAGLLVLAVAEQTDTGPLLPPNYFDPLLIGVPNVVAGACIGLLLTWGILRPPRRQLPARLRPTLAWLTARPLIPLALAVLATVIWLLPGLVTDSTLLRSGPTAAGHIPVQAEDYFSVVNGRTPLVNYIAQYANLLPLALAPVLAAFDSSITSFSISMCVLSAIGMMAIFGVFTEVTRRAWVALALYVPWVALSLFPWNQVGPFREFNGNYYGVLPGRYLGPFVLAWLCAASTRRAIPTWTLYGLAGLVVLNNMEFGSGALLGLIVATLASWDRALPLSLRLRDLTLQGAAGLLGALGLVVAVTMIRTGELPDLTLLTHFNQLFLRDSFGLEPMPTLGLHWVLYATYVAAILMAAVRYVRDDEDRTLTSMLAFSGAFGLSTGMYFVGRSSEFQLMLLFPAGGFALALVAWAAARSLRAAADDPARLRRLLIPGCAALIGFGAMVAAIDRFPPPWTQIDRLTASGAPLDASPVENYVEAHTHPGEHVLIIGPGVTHRVAERAGVVNVSPLNGVTALISPAEANLALDQLEDEGGTQVFDAVSNPPAGSFSFAIPEFATILRERGYRLVAENPILHLRLWRRDDR